jgi:hypothetical protein
MNKKEKEMMIEKVRKSYQVPGGSSYMFRSKNAIFISPSNSVLHEVSKAIACYQIRKWGDVRFNERISDLLRKLNIIVNETMKGFEKNPKSFISEAVPKSNKDRRVDIVILDSNTHLEIETDKRVKKKDAVTIYV